MTFCACRGYRQIRRPIASIEDLSNHDTIDLVGADGQARLSFNAELDLPQGRMVFTSNSAAAQLSAARAGYGVAVLSCRWASMYPELVRVLPDIEVSRAPMWLLTHEELRHSARIRALSDFIAARVQDDAELFERGVRALA